MISVIVPIYNAECHLTRCLDSIINQTYSELEIILVNDGSIDDSDKICKRYASNDSRIKYIFTENGGQGSARNKALHICKGEWISFVDSDDEIELDMYESMMKYSNINNTDLIICGWYRDHILQRREQSKVKVTTFYTNKELMLAYLTTPYITSSVCNKLYRRELWDGISFPEIRAREDAAIIYRILSRSENSVHTGESKYIQYVRKGSTERSKFNKAKMNSIDINRDLKKFINEKYPQYNKYVEFRVEEYCVMLMGEIISTFSFRDNKKEYNELMDILQKGLSDKKEYVDNDEYNRLYDVIRHQCLFRFEKLLNGIKNEIIDLIGYCIQMLSLKSIFS